MTRVLALEGGRNFRDLGGYSTLDGQRVRWGRVYRTGTMSQLTAHDHAQLKSLGIRVLCDFRTKREREREAVRWDGDGRVKLEWDYDPRAISLRALVSDSMVTPEVARDAMVRLYRLLPARFIEPYSALFDRLAAGDLPLVFGCSAGKDRTGIAAALVLTCLGVHQSEIVADFMLTNEIIDLEQALFEDPRRSVGLEDEHGYLARASREARAPLLEAAPEYLDAAFEQIARDHGSVARFLSAALGVDEAKSARIRQHLLEP